MSSAADKYGEALSTIYHGRPAPQNTAPVCRSTLEVGIFRLRVSIPRPDDARGDRARSGQGIVVDVTLGAAPLEPTFPGHLGIRQALLEINTLTMMLAEVTGNAATLPQATALIGRKAAVAGVRATRNGSELELSIRVPRGQEPRHGPLGYIWVYGRSSDRFRGGYSTIATRGGDIVVRLALDHSGPIGVAGALTWISSEGTLWVAGLGPHVLGGDPGAWDARATLIISDSRVVTAIPGVPGRIVCPTCRCRPDAALAAGRRFQLAPSSSCAAPGQGPVIVPDPLSLLAGMRQREIVVRGELWREALAALYSLALLRAGKEPGMGDIMAVDFSGPYIISGCTCRPSGDPVGIIAEAADVPEARSVEEIVLALAGLYPEAWLTGIREA